MSTPRSEMAERAAVLHQQGLVQREIGERLGIGRSYVHELLTDPDGVKVRARKDSYRKPCPECGRLMDGSGGKNGPRRCAACAAADPPSKLWTRETIVEAILEYVEVYGETPVAGHFDVGLYVHSGGPMYETALSRQHRKWPGVRAVKREFGTWNAAIEAAGLTPRPYTRRTHAAPSASQA